MGGIRRDSLFFYWTRFSNYKTYIEIMYVTEIVNRWRTDTRERERSWASSWTLSECTLEKRTNIIPTRAKKEEDEEKNRIKLNA